MFCSVVYFPAHPVSHGFDMESTSVLHTVYTVNMIFETRFTGGSSFFSHSESKILGNKKRNQILSFVLHIFFL